jgi:hypothetical protein
MAPRDSYGEFKIGLSKNASAMMTLPLKVPPAAMDKQSYPARFQPFPVATASPI